VTYYADDQATANRRPTFGRRDQNKDGTLDDVWVILEAAKDFGDHEAADACRRVIEAKRTGAPTAQSDLHLIRNYFR